MSELYSSYPTHIGIDRTLLEMRSKRGWAETGVSKIHPIGLDRDVASQILDSLHAKGVQDVPDAFLKDIDTALRLYRSAGDVRERSKPAEIRANLSRCQAQIERTRKAISSLDGNSNRILRAQYGPEVVFDMLNQLESFNVKFARALQHADSYPKRGRLNDYPRLFLAIDTAKAFIEHLHLKPTITKEGKFASVLSLIIQESTGHEPDAVLDLADRAIKQIYNLNELSNTE